MKIKVQIKKSKPNKYWPHIWDVNVTIDKSKKIPFCVLSEGKSFLWVWGQDQNIADSLHEACVDAIVRITADDEYAQGPVRGAIKELEDKK